MPVAPDATGALTLLDDCLDGAHGARAVADRLQLRPAEELPARLRLDGTDEELLVPKTLRQVAETSLDGAVQMSDGGEFLQVGGDLLVGHQRHRAFDCLQA